MMEEALYAYLVDHVPTVAGRVYPLRAPEKFEVPLLVYTTLSDIPDMTIDGATGSVRYLVQIDVYANTYAASMAIKKELRTALLAWEHPQAVFPTQTTHMREDTVTPSLYRVMTHWEFVCAE